MRICSFLPSATEIIYLLGLGDSLQAVSHECDFPTEAMRKPKVVRSRFDSDNLSSQEIDRVVTDMMTRGENIYEVDADILADARPDLVITQQLCEVCAVSFEDVQRAVAALSPVPTVLSLDPHSIDDVLDSITRVGESPVCKTPPPRSSPNSRQNRVRTPGSQECRDIPKPPASSGWTPSSPPGTGSPRWSRPRAVKT